jgi:hypothetical protein
VHTWCRFRAASIAGLALLLAAPVLATATTSPVAALPQAGSRTGSGITVTRAAGGTGVPQLAGTEFPLADVGYQQHEYLLSGTARSFTSATPLAPDGKWKVTPASTAPFTTRAVVYTPTDPKHFNGTVVVEWLNVTAGLDAAPVWLMTHDALVREGYAWIGVSAQRVGIDGAAGGGLGLPLGLKQADPARYGALTHPGDSYANDIFRQAGGVATRLLDDEGLRPRRVLAAGESQSAMRLVTYIDAFGADTPSAPSPFAGYLVYSRGAIGGPLSQEPEAALPAPNPTRIRTDVRAPVLVLDTESDVVGLGAAAAAQPDTARVHEWQVAGGAHADVYTLTIGATDRGDPASDVAMFQAMLTPPTSIRGGLISCASPVNTGPTTYVARAAVHALDRWVRRRTPPPTVPRLALVPGVDPPQFRLDADGNVQGGVRTPHVDAPVARLSGLGQTGGGFCLLFGTTTAFTAEQRAALAATHTSFVTQWNATTGDAVRAGTLLPADARALKAAAAASTVGD